MTMFKINVVLIKTDLKETDLRSEMDSAAQERMAFVNTVI